ncbi:MAG: sensor histidine kinase [Anaerolineales bacterium]
MTLRARLTIWYTGLLAGVLILFGTAVYLLLSFLLTQQINDTLLRTAEDIRSTAIRSVDGEVIAFPPQALALTAGVGVQLRRNDGEVAYQDPGMEELSLAPLNLNERSAVFRTETIGNDNYRVMTYPLLLQPEDEVIGFLQLASSLEASQQALQNLLVLMVVGGVVAAVAAGIVGWSTAGAALRPLDKVTETALHITRADDLSRRIPTSGPPRDEVGRLTLAFNETLERLETLFETQRRFLADVSHELRTPLTTIRGNVDLIDRMEQMDRESLEAIKAEVDRMTRMVNDLLLLAKAETGSLPLAMEEIELDTLMLDVFKQANLLASEGVEVEIGREDQVRVIGDRDRLRQVLLNLIANALDHTPSGGTVTLALACVEDWARLTVTDTGSGIPNDELPHIFERFYRIDRSRRRNHSGGAGLGLSIAYWITRSHNGRIEVASEEGRGTTFSVWLPRLENDCVSATEPLVQTDGARTPV